MRFQGNQFQKRGKRGQRGRIDPRDKKRDCRRR
jgi:hypothetical protein